jgi:cysteine-rich repeat protein
MDGDMDCGDKCQEVCGDAIRIDVTTPGKCDDGNKNNGDGCSELCDIERGWSCTGGSSSSADKCLEICGDGFNVGGW